VRIKRIKILSESNTVYEALKNFSSHISLSLNIDSSQETVYDLSDVKYLIRQETSSLRQETSYLQICLSMYM